METELIVTFLAWFLGGFVNIITGIGEISWPCRSCSWPLISLWQLLSPVS